jgi:hypothetical protein
MNVRFFNVKLLETYLALENKDPAALYFIQDAQRLYQGDKLIGVGANVSEVAAGLLSAEDYAEFKKLIADIGLQNAAPGQIPTMSAGGNLVWNNIALRRDNDYNYKKNENTFIPINGEVCLVDVAGYGLKAKIGNGVSTFAQLPYTDDVLWQNINSLIVKGYFYNGQFYKDYAHTELLANNTGCIYIDAINSKVYVYNGVQYTSLSGSISNATAEVAGLVKLYDTVGNNIDGSMTQRAITNELNEKFELDVIEEEEMIVFDNDIN